MTLTPKTRAILLMICAIFMFATMDAMAKLLASRIGTIPTIWVRYLGQTLVVFILVLPRLRSVLRTRYPKLQLARSIYLMCATIFFFYGISNIGLAEASAIMVPFFWHPIALSDLGLMIGLALAGTLGQLALIRALMQGEAGMLAPFAYFGLLFATVYGATIFGDIPDRLTVIGATTIAAAGIYVWYRETFERSD